MGSSCSHSRVSSLPLSHAIPAPVPNSSDASHLPESAAADEADNKSLISPVAASKSSKRNAIKKLFSIGDSAILQPTNNALNQNQNQTSGGTESQAERAIPASANNSSTLASKGSKQSRNMPMQSQPQPHPSQTQQLQSTEQLNFTNLNEIPASHSSATPLALAAQQIPSSTLVSPSVASLSLPLSPNPSQKMNPRQRFELQPGTLGKGHFAKVKKAKDNLTGRMVAIKIIEKKELVKSSAIVKAEIEILKTVGSHPNVVTLIDQFEDNHKFYLVMELCAGGDLFSRIVELGRFSQEQGRNCCQQLALALQHIHKCGVTHRDLKPENILLISPSLESPVKIADFGLSKLIRGHQNVMRTVCGTWAYCAPEVILRKPYTESVDNWTLGVLMYILLSGYHPFDVYGDMPEPELLQKIITCSYDFDDPVWETCAIEAKNLIRGLIQLDPTKRISLTNFLSSPWITGETQANSEPQPIVADRLSKFATTRNALRTLVVAKLASNKFKASLSRSSVLRAPSINQQNQNQFATNNRLDGPDHRDGGGSDTGGDNSLTDDFQSQFLLASPADTTIMHANNDDSTRSQTSITPSASDRSVETFKITINKEKANSKFEVTADHKTGEKQAIAITEANPTQPISQSLESSASASASELNCSIDLGLACDGGSAAEESNGRQKQKGGLGNAIFEKQLQQENAETGSL